MAMIVLKLGDWPGYLLRLGPRFKIAARRGAIRAGMRAVSTLQRATSAAAPANPQQVGVGGAVNTGYYKRAWKTLGTPDGADVFNTAVYAGVIEHGREPGRGVPLTPLTNWAQRRLGLSREEAKRVAYVISRRIKKRGLVARNVMEDSLPTIEADFEHEVKRELDRELASP